MQNVINRQNVPYNLGKPQKKNPPLMAGPLKGGGGGGGGGH